ncbi:MAG: hypothetical protein QOH90_1443, partial [Actinomycetota bacterium]|nr:hypothetical protein [Actinomycetota bacterium]
FRDTLLAEGKISESDLQLFTITDDVDSIVPYMQAVLDRGSPSDPRAEPHVDPSKHDAE